MKKIVPLTVFAVSVFTFALSAAPSYANEFQDAERVHRDNQIIRKDNRDINHDKSDIARDKNELKRDRAARNYYRYREQKAIEHGNLGAAEKFDRERREENREIRAEKHDLGKDRRDLNQDRRDRNAEIAKRNRDASRL